MTDGWEFYERRRGYDEIFKRIEALEKASEDRAKQHDAIIHALKMSLDLDITNSESIKKKLVEQTITHAITSRVGAIVMTVIAGALAYAGLGAFQHYVAAFPTIPKVN